MKKILELFNNLNEQTRYGLLVFAVILVVILDVVFLLLPQIGAIGNVNEQIKETSDNTSQVLTDRAGINLIKKNLEKTRMEFASLSKKVRSMQEVPAILGTISSVANAYDVKIDQLVPERDKMEVLTKSADGNFYALPILIKARCGYHNFGHFINNLENDDLFFVVKDFIIQYDDNDPHMHLFTLTINIILAEKALAPPKNV